MWLGHTFYPFWALVSSWRKEGSPQLIHLQGVQEDQSGAGKEAALQRGERRTDRTSGNWRPRRCSRLRNHHPYLENRIHLEVRALVYDPLLLVPEMSSAESAINYPLLGWVRCQDLFYQSAGCEKPDSAYTQPLPTELSSPASQRSGKTHP